jgi:hypothetical protein
MFRFYKKETGLLKGRLWSWGLGKKYKLVGPDIDAVEFADILFRLHSQVWKIKKQIHQMIIGRIIFIAGKVGFDNKHIFSAPVSMKIFFHMHRRNQGMRNAFDLASFG